MKEYKRPEGITDDELLEQIFNGATQVFGGGIYIATSNHSSEYDYLSFEDLESWGELTWLRVGEEGFDLNDGSYYTYNEKGEFLIDVLNDNGWKYEFEKSEIEW